MPSMATPSALASTAITLFVITPNKVVTIDAPEDNRNAASIPPARPVVGRAHGAALRRWPFYAARRRCVFDGDHAWCGNRYDELSACLQKGTLLLDNLWHEIPSQEQRKVWPIGGELFRGMDR